MKILIVLILSMTAISASAQRRYIDGIQKITFRTGPGTDNKIIRMLETNAKVTLLEEGEKWSKIKDAEGDEGYVLNRFITKQVPFVLQFKWMKSEYDKLKEKNEELTQTITTLKTELKDTKGKLSETETSLQSTQMNFEELKTGSADYIGLKKEYDMTVEKLKSQTRRVKKLEDQVDTYYIKWFLAGGSVLFLGWLIGLISRKKKRYTSSIRL